ncbi:MAG TPA: helix-turn-helix domain-containing protein [Rectinemataceae bacterium]|nr:helix-turn-helix domain-containing protein [Rectinemataceae bacterium]
MADRTGTVTPRPPPAPAYGDAASLDSLERAAIERALAKWEGNRSKAAAELGISRRTIQNKIKRFGLD